MRTRSAKAAASASGGEFAEEAEFAATEGSFEAVEEQPAEGLRPGQDGEQEVRLAGDPPLPVEGAAAGDEAMDMGVMGQGLPPGVHDGDQADFGAEALGGERRERPGGRAHEQAVDGLLVLEGDLGRRRRQGEDGGEPLGARRPLTLAAMAIATRVVGDASNPQSSQRSTLTAERRRAAGGDRADHAPFHAPELFGVRPFVTFTVSVEDVGQFERRPNPHRLFRRRHLKRQPIERALGPADHLRRDARVARRREQIVVAERTRVIMHLLCTH